ncbi:MAG: hypothetical protein Q4B70_08100, partial [Lachnospiraceae bacterium]|nr:hypothetical protein [Lachnospiraceae bacterium]
MDGKMTWHRKKRVLAGVIVLVLCLWAAQKAGWIQGIVDQVSRQEDNQVASNTIIGSEDNIFSVELRKGGETGDVITDLVKYPDKDYTLERDVYYSLLIRVNKTTPVNENGYVRLFFGQESDSGSTAYNGLTFQNPPGALFSTGSFSGHTYLDAVTKRTDITNPTYGNNQYTMQDGEFIYRIQDNIQQGSEVYFVMQFMIDDTGYDGSGILEDGMKIQVGKMQDGIFSPESTLISSLPVEEKDPVGGYFNGTSKTATLGESGQILTYYTREVDNISQVGFLY